MMRCSCYPSKPYYLQGLYMLALFIILNIFSAEGAVNMDAVGNFLVKAFYVNLFLQ